MLRQLWMVVAGAEETGEQINTPVS